MKYSYIFINESSMCIFFENLLGLFKENCEESLIDLARSKIILVRTSKIIFWILRDI